MIKLDIHTHSVASGHATNETITDMAKQAAKIGLNILGISDHGPATPGACKPSYFRSLLGAPRIRYGIEMLYGVELNILDNKGTFDLDSDILANLDFAIASMHIQNKEPGSTLENTEGYIQAMKNPFVKLIGHCDDSKYPVDYQSLVAAAKEHHVLLEVNNSSLSPEGYRGETVENNKQLLKYCMAYHQPIVLASDSHGSRHVGDVAYAEALITTIDFPKELILNYDIDKFKSYMQL